MLNLSNKTQAKGFILRGWFKRPVLFVAFLMTLFTATAQQYPVIGTMQLTSPVPVSWVKFTEVLSNKAVLNLTLIDGELGSRNVKLKMYIEKGNTLIATSSDVIANAPALTLVPNILQQVSGIKITPYFQFNNLQGMAQSQYDKQLDEGLYRLTFEVYNSVTNERLSAPIVQDFFITLNNPPTLSQPANGEQVETSATTLVFQWLSQANTSGVLSTIPASQLTLVEVPSGTTDIAALFNVPTPKFTQAVTSPNTSITVIKAALGLIADRTYAWRVQVVDPLQRNQPNAAFKNYGYSDIFTFTYATLCPVVTNLVLEAKSSDVVAATWKQVTDHYSYRVAYRKYSTNTIWQWVEVQSANNALNLTGLEAATEYEVRIGGICNGNKVGFGTPVRVITLAAGQLSGLNCSMPNVVAPTGLGIPMLLVGDVITAGDFPVTLTQVSGANGNFNGKGWIRVPWLLNIKIAVTFTGLGVNTAKKVTSGFVETVYDPTWGNVLDLDKTIQDIKDFATIIRDLINMSIDEDYRKIFLLVNSLLNTAQNELPPALLTQLNAATDKLLQARTDYENAQKDLTNAQTAAEKAAAQARLDDAKKRWTDAQTQLNTVQKQKEETLKKFADIMKKALIELYQEVRTGQDSISIIFGQAASKVKQYDLGLNLGDGINDASSVGHFVMLNESTTSLTAPVTGLNSTMTADFTTYLREKQSIDRFMYKKIIYERFTTDERIDLLGKAIKSNDNSLIKEVLQKITNNIPERQIMDIIKTSINTFITNNI